MLKTYHRKQSQLKKKKKNSILKIGKQEAQIFGYAIRKIQCIQKNESIFLMWFLHFFYIIFKMWYWFLLSNQEKQQNESQGLIANPIEPYKQYYNGNQVDYSKIIPNNLSLIASDETVKCQMPTTSFLKCSFNIQLAPQYLRKQKKTNPQNTIIPNSQQKKINKKLQTKKQCQINESKSESGKNPGRNSTSNIFRVFVKLCSKSKFETILEKKFKEISEINSFFISFEYFKIRVKQLAPSTSNYINVKEFKKACEGSDQFSKAFRCLFHWFLNNYAINHCLTLKGKHRMMKESIMCFLGNLHDIESELWKQQDKQMAAVDEDCQSGASTV